MIKKIHTFFILLLFLGAGSLRSADSILDLSMDKAISKALSNNFQVKIFRQQEKVADINNTWGAAGRYPAISAGLDLQTVHSDAPVSGTDSRLVTSVNSVSPYINMRWTLFNGFAVSITRQKLSLLNRISKGNSALTVENTIQAVILAYYNALLQQQQLNISRELRQLSKDRFDYVKMKKDLGSAGTYDELQAKIAFLDDTARCHSQMMTYRAALRNLNQIMGEPGENEYSLTSSFSHNPQTFMLEDLLKKMYSSNRTLQNQFLNQELKKKEIGLSRSLRYPTLTLNSGASLESSGVKAGSAGRNSSSSYNYYVGFSLGVTLYNGGAVSRAIASAKISLRIARLQTSELKLTLKNQLLNLLDRYNIRKQLLKVAEEKMASARLSLQISGEKFRSGAINSFNYRDAQLVYLNSAFEKLSAVYNLIESNTDLVRITGGIIRED